MLRLEQHKKEQTPRPEMISRSVMTDPPAQKKSREITALLSSEVVDRSTSTNPLPVVVDRRMMATLSSGADQSTMIIPPQNENKGTNTNSETAPVETAMEVEVMASENALENRLLALEQAVKTIGERTS